MTPLSVDRTGAQYGGSTPISTGHLPAAEQVQQPVQAAYERFKPEDTGRNADYYPALATVPSQFFGVCVAAIDGATYAASDTDYRFTIMSVAKPFVFALVVQAIGAEQAQAKLGVNSTGLPFNSVTAVELNADRLTNPMVNPGALAATSLAPGTTLEAIWHFIHDGLSRFAGRALPSGARRDGDRWTVRNIGRMAVSHRTTRKERGRRRNHHRRARQGWHGNLRAAARRRWQQRQGPVHGPVLVNAPRTEPVCL